MVRAVVLAGVLAGCGRVGFDLHDRAIGDASSDGRADGPAGDVPAGVITRWQQSIVVNTVGPATLSLAAPTMPGSLLVIALAANDLSTLVLPNGWVTAATTGANGSCFALLAYVPDSPSVNSVSYTMSAGAPNVAQLIEIVGASPTAPLDVVGQSNVSSPVTTQSVSSNAPTTTTRDLAIAMFCEDVNTPTYSPDPAWMRLGTVTNGSASTSYEADFTIANTPGVVTETVTSSVSGKYAGVIAAFK